MCAENGASLRTRRDICDLKKEGWYLLHQVLALHKYALIQSLAVVLTRLSIKATSLTNFASGAALDRGAKMALNRNKIFQ